MKKCKTKKSYSNGGTLDSVLPMIPAALGMANPILGTASGVALNMLQNSKQNTTTNPVVNSNPYGFELGGKLIGNEGIEQYSGAKHGAEGGIKVNPQGIPVQMSNQEVEDGEILYTTKSGQKYVFSNKLKYHG